MATRTIALDLKTLEGGIEALSSASRAFQLTPFERRAYRALVVSAEVVAWSFLAVIAIIVIIAARGLQPEDLTPVQQALVFAPLAAFVVAFTLAVVVGIISLALNFPLVSKLYREKGRLEQLGLSSLSKSLWKESRRSRWISRAHGTLLIAVAILTFLVAVLYGVIGTTVKRIDDEYFEIAMISFAVFFATMAALIFSARYLHNQRERMELTANAEDLKKAFERLRQHAGTSEVVSVPSELLEQAARIESALIAKERKDAVLLSVGARPTGYAITFDPDAAKDRATLGVADRVELEDLVAQLSIEGEQLKSQGGAVARAEGATLRNITKSQSVEIEYIIEQASHGIRITAVRSGGGGSHSSPNDATLAKIEQPEQKQPEHAPEAKAAAGESTKLIYFIICDEKDRKASVPMRNRCKQLGFEVALSALEGDASEVRKTNQQSLASCDVVMLWYGAGDEFWKKTIDSELRKIAVYRSGKPPPAIYTYLAEPRTWDKQDLIDMEEPRLIDGMGGFEETTIAKSIQAVSEPPVKS